MAKVKIQIKSYFGKVLFEWEAENNTIKETLSRAVLSGAVLSGADLSDADLSDAVLSGVVLSGADLSDADLSGAVLRDAVLSGVVLSGADLSGADLSGADLSDADLSDAVLSGVVLSGADLSDADLSGAVLRDAVLSDAVLSGVVLSGADPSQLGDYTNQCSRDMLFIFQHLKAELPGLRAALVEGRINGTQYEGECACLIGTLAKLDGGITKVCSAIPFYEKGLNNYAEQWFYQIRTGDTPKNNKFAAHALKLIDSVLEPSDGKKPVKRKGKNSSTNVAQPK